MKYFVLFLALGVSSYSFACDGSHCHHSELEKQITLARGDFRLINLWQCDQCQTWNTGFQTHCQNCLNPRDGEQEVEDEE